MVVHNLQLKGLTGLHVAHAQSVRNHQTANMITPETRRGLLAVLVLVLLVVRQVDGIGEAEARLEGRSGLAAAVEAQLPRSPLAPQSHRAEGVLQERRIARHLQHASTRQSRWQEGRQAGRQAGRQIDKKEGNNAGE